MDEERNIATNRKARYDYFIEDRIEAGIALHGGEVKSLRDHGASLVEGYARVYKGEVWLHDVHITPYKQSTHMDIDPVRMRKLLLHKREILRLQHRTDRKGYTLIPLRMYFRNGYAKVELGVCQGKRQYDKRQAIADRDERRDLERQLRERTKE